MREFISGVFVLALFGLGCGTNVPNFATSYKTAGVSASTDSSVDFSEDFFHFRFFTATDLFEKKRPPSYRSNLAAGDIAQNSTAPSAMEFYITHIQLCESIEVNGTAYNNPSGCTTVVGNSGTTCSLTLETAADDSSSNWVDLMSATSMAAAQTTSEEVSAGLYNYTLIETCYPMRVSANVTVPNAGNLKTCSGGTISGTSGSEKVTVSDMVNCTQSKIPLRGRGGGVWVKMGGAVTMESGVQYALDLVTNPIGLFTGWNSVQTNTEVTYVSGSHTIGVPVIPFAAVLRKSDQSTYREQYNIAMTTPTAGTVVVDLYYAGATTDVGSATVVGASTRFINDSSSGDQQTLYSPYTIDTASDGAITLGTSDGKSFISGLNRATTSESGATDEVTIDTTVWQGGAGNVTATATYQGLTEM